MPEETHLRDTFGPGRAYSSANVKCRIGFAAEMMKLKGLLKDFLFILIMLSIAVKLKLIYTGYLEMVTWTVSMSMKDVFVMYGFLSI